MKFDSGKFKFKKILERAKTVQRRASALARRLNVQTPEGLETKLELEERYKRVQRLQDKLLSWHSAESYMLMHSHFVREERGGREIGELSTLAAKKRDTTFKELLREVKSLGEFVLERQGLVGGIDEINL